VENVMKKAPLVEVRERFGDKSKLVQAVQDLTKGGLWLDRLNDDKGLALVSNRKLLHLHGVLSEVKSQFGSREKLIDAILERDKRAGDAGYRSRLERYATPRLLDHYRGRKAPKVKAS
jgi:hypothetical protein